MTRITELNTDAQRRYHDVKITQLLNFIYQVFAAVTALVTMTLVHDVVTRLSIVMFCFLACLVSSGYAWITIRRFSTVKVADNRRRGHAHND